MSGCRVTVLALSLFLLIDAGARALPPAGDVPPEALAAAQQGLPRFLRALPEAELAHYGFDSSRDLARATLGEPFRLYTLEPEDIFAGARGSAAAMEGRATNRVLFPVVCDDRPRTILTIAEIDGIWQAIALGGLSPAPQLLELERQWPAGEGYRLRYIQVYPGGTQFVQVAQEDFHGLVPLESTARSLGLLGPDEAYDFPILPPDEIAIALEPIVRAGLSE
jgi:hypothetical protein